MQHVTVMPPTHLTTCRIGSGADARSYMLLVPSSYDGRRAAPVVIDFHGSGSHPEEQLAIDGMAVPAQARGLIVVLPVATVPFALGGYTWNLPAQADGPDEVRYVAAVLDDVARRVHIDAARIYATGFSGGARLATSVACALSDRIAALGAVSGLRAPAEDAGPLPVIAFHGAADPLNPYAGGGPAYWGYGVEEALAGWAEVNSCAARTTHRAGEGVQQIVYVDRRGEAGVVLYRFAGGGHTWPGSAVEFPRERFGVTPRGVDATTLMLEFFARHRLASTRPVAAVASSR